MKSCATCKQPIPAAGDEAVATCRREGCNATYCPQCESNSLRKSGVCVSCPASEGGRVFVVCAVPAEHLCQGATLRLVETGGRERIAQLQASVFLLIRGYDDLGPGMDPGDDHEHLDDGDNPTVVAGDTLAVIRPIEPTWEPEVYVFQVT